MSRTLYLNGASLGQSQLEIERIFGPFRECKILDDARTSLTSLKQGVSFLLEEGRVVCIQGGEHLSLPGGLSITKGMSPEEVQGILGDPESYKTGDYHTFEFDAFDQEIPHPDSPGVILMFFSSEGHEVRVECSRGPQVSAIAIRDLRSL